MIRIRRLANRSRRFRRDQEQYEIEYLPQDENSEKWSTVTAAPDLILENCLGSGDMRPTADAWAWIHAADREWDGSTIGNWVSIT